MKAALFAENQTLSLWGQVVPARDAGALALPASETSNAFIVSISPEAREKIQEHLKENSMGISTVQNENRHVNSMLMGMNKKAAWAAYGAAAREKSGKADFDFFLNAEASRSEAAQAVASQAAAAQTTMAAQNESVSAMEARSKGELAGGENAEKGAGRIGLEYWLEKEPQYKKNYETGRLKSEAGIKDYDAAVWDFGVSRLVSPNSIIMEADGDDQYEYYKLLMKHNDAIHEKYGVDVRAFVDDFDAAHTQEAIELQKEIHSSFRADPEAQVIMAKLGLIGVNALGAPTNPNYRGLVYIQQ